MAIAGAYNNNGDCDNVILASGNSLPDALSASILSKKLNAPILLVGPTVDALSDAFNYLYTHESRQRGTVYIMGGTGVIGPDFETKLASMMFTNIKRLGGSDRYDTNMLIVNEVNVPQGTPVFVASDITNMITTEVGKIVPNVPVETVTSLIQQELSKLSLSVNVSC